MTTPPAPSEVSAPPAPAASPPEPTTYRLSFTGTGGSFFLIFLKNVFLSLLTLGIYFAWGKTERRKYVWNNLSFHDQPLRYTGTGMELFKGYLVVIAGYFVFLGVPGLIGQFSTVSGAVVQGVMAVLFFIAAPYLIYRSRGFLYNRTVWRGIRFGLLKDEARPYARTFIVGTIQILLTLGIFSPIVTNRLYRIMTDATRFGSLEFRYTGEDREAFWIGLKGMVFTLLTFGIYFFWWSAEALRYQLAHTHVGEHATLRSELTGGDLFVLFLLSAFGTTLTLGLAFPWITMHSIRVVAEKTFVDGFIDFEDVAQRTREAGATSDGFADAFDLDLGI